MKSIINVKLVFCNTCAWYRKIEQHIQKTSEYGECRGSTPIFDSVKADTIWPIVSRWDWCANYTYRNEVYRGDDPWSLDRK